MAYTPPSIVWEHKYTVTRRLQRHATAKIKPWQPPPPCDRILGSVCYSRLRKTPAAGFAKWRDIPRAHSIPTRGDLARLTWPKRLVAHLLAGNCNASTDECNFSVYHPATGS